MQKYCGYCGAALEEESGKCPMGCETVVAQNKKKNKGIMMLTGFVASVCAVALITAVALFIVRPNLNEGTEDISESAVYSTAEVSEDVGSGENEADSEDKESSDTAYAENGDAGFLEFEMKEAQFEWKTSSGELYFTNKLEYPYFLGDSDVEKEINSRYEELIEKYNSRTAQQADENYANATRYGSVNLPYYENTTAKVTYNEGGYISVFEQESSYTGGGHAYHYEHPYTYKLESGEKLEYSYFFDCTEKQADLRLNQAFYYADAGDRLKVDWYKDCPYVLTEEGICFYYNGGDASPRNQITVPYTQAPFVTVEEAEEDDIKALLLNNYWYDKIQIHHRFLFLDDGRLIVCPGEGSIEKCYTYRLEGDTLYISNNGYTTKMKFINEKDDYNWEEDAVMYDEMNENEWFFYETDYVDTDEPVAASWMRIER